MRTREESARARLLVDSLRTHGGPLADSEMWMFVIDSDGAPWDLSEGQSTSIHELRVPEGLEGYFFSEKVCACALAERMAAGTTGSLVWMSTDTLVVRPPVLYELGLSHDAALRPVHVQNVGLRADSPLDGFWRKVCDAVWLSDVDQLVESFVDGQTIRAYFNSHSCSVNPLLGLFTSWRESFAKLVLDKEFQQGPCRDDLHRVFLHQAVLSAQVIRSVLPGRLRILPPEYSYPYNLHSSVPDARKAKSLSDIVTLVYEDRSIAPKDMTDIAVDEPLRSWLSARTGAP